MADDTNSGTYETEVAEMAQNGPVLHPGCSGLPDCRWLAGLLPHNGPFVTDHAGWHAAGSHATVYGDDGPSCNCGAGTYQGDNDGAFPHLADHEMVIVCADTGQRIGYSTDMSSNSTPVGFKRIEGVYRCNRVHGGGLCWAKYRTYSEALACSCQAETVEAAL